jgi:hypothetical protein
MSPYVDVILFMVLWLAAQIIFHGFEAHVSPAKRLAKFVVISAILGSIYGLVGRGAYYGAVAIMTVGIAILHGYYFHYRHGIHWRTAEPRARYLALVDKNEIAWILTKKCPADEGGALGGVIKKRLSSDGFESDCRRYHPKLPRWCLPYRWAQW